MKKKAIRMTIGKLNKLNPDIKFNKRTSIKKVLEKIRNRCDSSKVNPPFLLFLDAKAK